MTDLNLLRIISDVEQDQAACEKWWNEATDTEKLRVWNAIQTKFSDPAMEIVSRFAQLKFSEMMLKGR